MSTEESEFVLRTTGKECERPCDWRPSATQQKRPQVHTALHFQICAATGN